MNILRDWRPFKMKITKRKSINAGVSIGDDGQFNFNWKTDNSESDILLLNQDTSGTFDSEGVAYIYGYVFNPKSTGSQRKVFRDALKSEITNTDIFISNDVDNFVENGVLRLENYKRFDEFSATVTIESTKPKSLVDIISMYFSEYLENTTPEFTFKLIKQMYEDVEFDSVKAYNSLIDAGYRQYDANRVISKVMRRFDSLKLTKQLFEMKKFLPREIREGFYNFLKFKTNEQAEAYMSLQCVNVLIYDDFLTSGTTIKEIIRYLRSIHSENTLTVFVLIKQ